MVTLGQLSGRELSRRLKGDGVVLRTGPFSFRLQSPLPGIAAGLACLYDHMPLADDSGFCDYTVAIRPGAGVRRWVRRQACFEFDGQRVFEPLPEPHAHALMEWAMNWCISAHAHQFLILHAAVLERGGAALVMPAPPGSGKSTLCAALALSGWRLLSDELALVEPASGRIWPLCRPVSLKNRSIDVIRALAPDAVFGRVAEGTAKGSVAHLRVNGADVARMDEPAGAGWVVFPRYQAGSATVLRPRARAGTVVELARNAFNMPVLADQGFHALADLVAASQCHDFQYSQLPEAIACFNRLADEHQAAMPARTGADTAHPGGALRAPAGAVGSATSTL